MDYVYVFKTVAKNKLSHEYKQTSDKISYEDINKMTDKYSLFIRKLLSLIYGDRDFNYKEIKDYLHSNNTLDRLKGLKECKYYIKLVSDKEC